MKKYHVIYTLYRGYTVEANNEDEAEEKAYAMFESDMSEPVAQTDYDEVGIYDGDWA